MTNDSSFNQHSAAWPMQSKLLRPIAMIALAAVPALVSILLVVVCFDAWLGSYWPVVNDDVTFNLQIRTMSVAGLGGGYFNFNETLPVLSALKGGAHGPLYPAFYGLLLAPFGDVVAGPVYLNHVLLTLCLYASFVIARTTFKKALIASILAATFWPIFCMSVLSMQETLHFCIGMLLAGLMVRGRPAPAMALVVLASLVRPLWALAALPHIGRADRLSGWGVKLAATGAVAIISMLVLVLTAAPSSMAIFSFAARTDTGGDLSPLALLASALIQRLPAVGANVQYFFDPRTWLVLEGHVFVLTALLVTISLVAAIRQLARGDVFAAMPASQWSGFMTLLALLAVFALYDTGAYRGFRTLAPLVLMGILCLVYEGKHRMVVATLLINVAFVWQFTSFYPQVRADGFGAAGSRGRAWRASLAQDLAFHRGLDPWCNTVLVDDPALGPLQAAIPAGIGISVLFGVDKLPETPRSRYLWLSRPDNIGTAMRNPSFRELRVIEKAVLFRNASAPCG